MSAKEGNKISSIPEQAPIAVGGTADGESTPQTLLAVVTDESAMLSIYNIASRKKVVKKNADLRVGIFYQQLALNCGLGCYPQKREIKLIISLFCNFSTQYDEDDSNNYQQSSNSDAYVMFYT